MAEPIQLSLFPDHATLARIHPDRNEWRFYRLAVWPALFGRIRLDPHPDAGAALNTLARLARSKGRRDYRNRIA